MISSHSLDVVVSQCKRFGLTESEIDVVRGKYNSVQDAYLNIHVNPSMNADVAIGHHHKAQETAYKEAAKTICSIIDRIQSQGDGVRK